MLGEWLKSNPTFRVATDSDCRCSEEIAEIRKGSGDAWKPNPRYHPYYVSGDFNGDGTEDFAVVLVGSQSQLHLAIFNGRFLPGTKPAYLSSDHVGALFYGPPRPRPYRLIIGAFGSEGGSLKPEGGSYSYVGSN